MQQILFGSDYGGEHQLNELTEELSKFGDVIDVREENPHLDDYVKIAQHVSERAAQDGGYGVLICGTGIGVSIVANKHNGVHAARCVSCDDAEDCKLVNNATMLCLSGKTPVEENKKIIEKFFTTHFHEKPKAKSYRDDRVESVRNIEKSNFKEE